MYPEWSPIADLGVGLERQELEKVAIRDHSARHRDFDLAPRAAHPAVVRTVWDVSRAVLPRQ